MGFWVRWRDQLDVPVVLGRKLKMCYFVYVYAKYMRSKISLDFWIIAYLSLTTLPWSSASFDFLWYFGFFALLSAAKLTRRVALIVFRIQNYASGFAGRHLNGKYPRMINEWSQGSELVRKSSIGRKMPIGECKRECVLKTSLVLVTTMLGDHK